MPEEKKPYVENKPGDLWTAEIWNGTQVMIKEDIEANVKALRDEIDKDSVKALRDEINKNGVNLAKNAEKLAGKTSAEWENDFDAKYALKTHSHPEKGSYILGGSLRIK